jgi:hypothetical protein
MGWKQRTQSQWQRLVEEWERSELTPAAYCRKKGISVASLQRWKRLLADDGRCAPEHIPGHAPSPGFLPVQLVEHADPSADADLTVVLPDGVRIEVGPQCSGDRLRAVLDALRSSA